MSERKLVRSEHFPARVAMVMDYSLNYLGGAQSAFLDEAEALSQFGHEVSIVAPGTADSVWANRWEGSIFGVKPRGTIPVVDLPYIPNSRQLRNSLADFFERQNISVVHVHSEFGLAHAAVEAAHSLGIPVVFTVHTFFWEARLPKPLDRAVAPMLRRGLLRLTGHRITGEDVTGSPLAAAEVDATLRGATLTLAKLADTVVSPSAHQARTLREALGEPAVPEDTETFERVRVVPNCAQHTEAAGSALEQVQSPLRIVWVGRVVQEKRILEFIEAVRLACERADLVVEVIGTGPLLRQAKRAARNLPVSFCGRLSRAEVQQRVRDAHLTALTSYGFDNQPMTVVESIHSRRPVLLCDTRLTEGLNGPGLYTSGPEPAAIAEKIVELCQDPEQVLAAAAATEQQAIEFSPANHVAKLRNVYAAAAQAGGQQRETI